MLKFKNNFGRRVAMAKFIGFVVWLIWFFWLSFVFDYDDLFFRFAILFWYTTFWSIIWIFWIMDKHPLMNFSMPFWFRWIFIWAWLNLLVVFFSYDIIVNVMAWSVFDWYSPFWIVLEWAIIWLLIDWISTKYYWEGENSLK